MLYVRWLLFYVKQSTGETNLGSMIYDIWFIGELTRDNQLYENATSQEQIPQVGDVPGASQYYNNKSIYLIIIYLW